MKSVVVFYDDIITRFGLAKGGAQRIFGVTHGNVAMLNANSIAGTIEITAGTMPVGSAFCATGSIRFATDVNVFSHTLSS
jgi:hypothetical protein